MNLRNRVLAAILPLVLLSCNEHIVADNPGNGSNSAREEVFAKLGGWKFRVEVVAEKQTVTNNGGEEAFLEKMDKMMEKASKRFSVSGINDNGGNQMNFYITSYKQFEGASSYYLKEDIQNSKSCDLRIVVNSSSKENNSWYPAPNMSISLSSDNIESEETLESVVSLLAQSRGVYDMSRAIVNEGCNSISGDTYEPETTAGGWSEYEKTIINRSAGERVGINHYDLMPDGTLKAKLVMTDGSKVSKASLRFFPVYPGTGKVTATPLYEGELSITGNFVFQRNPFIVPDQTDKNNNVANYLVEVLLDNTTRYTWFPIDKAEMECLQTGSNVCTIVVPDEAIVIPKDDYINRQLEFKKLPGWKIRCKVYVEENTLKDNATDMIAFKKKVDQFMRDCSSAYSVSGINDEGDNQMHFFALYFETFKGKSSTLRSRYYIDSTRFDLAVFINTHYNDDGLAGGYLGKPYYNIGHNWTSSGGLWSGYGLDAMIHELGHSRGVIDLYGEKVNAENNPISGKAYDSITCKMNGCYGVPNWSSFAKALINESGGRGHALNFYDFFSKYYRVRVLTANGTSAEGAQIKCYPVKAYSYSVASTPDYEFTLTSAQDYYQFPQNPFITKGSTNVESNNFNYLISVTYKGKTTYSWMPLHESQESYAKTKNETYTHTIILSE